MSAGVFLCPETRHSYVLKPQAIGGHYRGSSVVLSASALLPAKTQRRGYSGERDELMANTATDSGLGGQLTALIIVQVVG